MSYLASVFICIIESERILSLFIIPETSVEPGRGKVVDHLLTIKLSWFKRRLAILMGTTFLHLKVAYIYIYIYVIMCEQSIIYLSMI